MKLKSGVKREQILSEYKLKHYSNLTEIMKNESKIVEKYNSLNGKTSANVFNTRGPTHVEVEKALLLWLRQMRNKNVSLNTEVILKTGEKFAKTLGVNDFKPTTGYLAGLKKRAGLLFSKKYGESVSVDNNVIEKWSTELSSIIRGYKPEDVYNLDETALFYRLMPSKTYSFSDESTHGCKKSKDRITLVLITNADGTDRMCSMIGKSAKPRAFRGQKVLPIDYYSQPNAWIDLNIFGKIVSKFNSKMKKKNKKVLLFIDNCSTHTEDIKLSNVCIKFFPPNSTSALQPLDQGIIHSFKSKYRKELIGLMISKLEVGSELKPNSIDLFVCMNLIDISLKSVSNQTIINCFRKAKFEFSNNSTEMEVMDTEVSEVMDSNTNEDIDESEDNFWDNLKQLSNIEFESFDSYVSIDANESIDFGNDLTDDQIIDLVRSESNPQLIVVSDEEYDETQDIQTISKAQALDSINTLQKYFSQIDNNFFVESLNQMHKKVIENTFKSLKQQKITNFISNSM